MDTVITSYAELATPFDTLGCNRARRAESYDKGLKTGQNATEFHISISGVWSTTNRDGSSTFSYERLGYHANTAYFFAGIVASGVKITDYRVRA